MPKGQIRDRQAGRFHFAAFSRYRRHPSLGNLKAFSVFERELESAPRCFNPFAIDYAFTPECVHPLVTDPGKANLARALQLRKQKSSRELWWLDGDCDSGTEKLHHFC
jgi:hypothetical protein